MKAIEAIKIIKELIRSVERVYKTNPLTDKEPHPETDALTLAISALEKQEADRWIPVTERLPEEKDAGILKKLGTNKRSDYVLATVEVKGERMTVTACTYDGKWDWNMKYAFPDYKVIAWHPLPEPYKEEDHDCVL